jgi:putative hydrolase of the HAD superfamily
LLTIASTLGIAPTLSRSHSPLRSGRLLGHPSPVFRALFLDLDDTVFDRGAAFGRWVRARIGTLDDTALRLLVEIDDRGRRSRDDVAAYIATRYRVTIDPDAFSLELAEHVEPEPGAREMIARLAATRRVAIVSNGGGPAQRAKLARAGLADVVHAVFVSGELGETKPAPAIFERALRWAEHAATDCLFVGDDPSNDLAPAAALGMPTAWIAREPWPEELAAPRFTLRSLAELEAIA